jgi:hypothetical protein
VRSLGFHPEPSSHDWHVQPSCQRTDPLPPERALSVQCRFAGVGTGFNPSDQAKARPPQTQTCLSSKLVQTTRSRGHCQPVAITGFPPVFHSRGALRFYIWAVPMWDRVSDPVRSSKARLAGAVSTRQNASSSRLVAHRTMPFRHKPRRKTISLIKDHLEVLAHVRLESLTYRTLRGTLSPNEAPWPGLICRN